MQTDSHMDEQEIKRYLYGEMSDEERDRLEEEFFENDEIFFEINDLENRLVDQYARNKLVGAELTRFQKSLTNLPERRAKVANAVALQTLIDEERPQKEAAAEPVAPTIWQKIADFFTIKNSAFGYSMASLLVLFAFASVFLLIDNRRKSSEIADLQNNSQTVWQEKQRNLEAELAAVNERVGELQKQAEMQGKEGDRVFGELQNVTDDKQRIEKELEQLKKERNLTPTPKQTNVPTLATFLLTPTISTRGDGGTGTRNLSIEPRTKQISMRLVLPDDTGKEDRFSVALNGNTLASNILPAQKSLQIKLAPEDIADGLNKISVINAEGKEVSKYIFNMKKK